MIKQITSKEISIFFLTILITITAVNYIYADGIYANNTNAFGIQGDEEYLVVAEEMPEPVGGLPAIIKNIVYPQVALKAGIEGKVYLLAYINEKGNVDDVKIVKGIGAGCDEAAVDAVKKTRFNPGKNKGVAVKVKLSIPIMFKK